MQTYRVCPAATRAWGQKDSLPFNVRAANIDALRKALANRKTDATLFFVEHPVTGRTIGHFIITSGKYIWENSNNAYLIDPRTGKIGERRP